MPRQKIQRPQEFGTIPEQNVSLKQTTIDSKNYRTAVFRNWVAQTPDANQQKLTLHDLKRFLLQMVQTGDTRAQQFLSTLKEHITWNPTDWALNPEQGGGQTTSYNYRTYEKK